LCLLLLLLLWQGLFVLLSQQNAETCGFVACAIQAQLIITTIVIIIIITPTKQTRVFLAD